MNAVQFANAASQAGRSGGRVDPRAITPKQASTRRGISLTELHLQQN